MVYVNVQCVEPDRLPLVISYETTLLERFRLFVLSDVRASAGGSLRSTILLGVDDDPPPEATLVFELDVYDPGAGDPPLFRIRRMGARCQVDLVRPNVRSRMADGGELAHGSRIEILMQDTRRIPVTLQMETDLIRSSSAVGGGALRHKPQDDVNAGWFLYNSVYSLMTLNLQILKDRTIVFLRKIGIHPWVVIMIITIGSVLGYLAYNAWVSHKASQDAEERADALAQAHERAEAARENALNNEMACMQERRALATRLKDIQEVKKIYAIQAINTSLSQTVALETGGSRMMEDPVKPFDEQYVTNLEKEVMVMMDTVTASYENMTFCTEQDSVLGADLHPMMLVWHPDPSIVCPVQYSTIDKGINRMGSWGLSERVAKEFGSQNFSEGGEAGQQQLTDQLGDPRMAPRWSATTMALGLREVQFTLLTADTGARVPVAPSLTHIWALALWDAYNRLPSPATGVMDKPVGHCVDQVMNSLMNSPDPAIPGSPVLPDITLVAKGEQSLVIPPSPGCPWPQGVFKLSAEAAVKAVANWAIAVEGAEAAAANETSN